MENQEKQPVYLQYPPTLNVNKDAKATVRSNILIMIKNR